MTGKEKVLHGLNSCGFYDGIPNICEVTECPYRDNKAYCVHELAHDAGMLISELLKAQEPRVMTHYDMENVEPGNVVWCEQRDEVRTYLTPLIRYDDIFENRWLGVEPQAVFLPNIRFWTSRPTDEQREAVPWE